MQAARNTDYETRVEQVMGRFRAAYLDTQYHYVQFLTEHMVDCAASFDGDLEAMLLLAVLGQRRLEEARNSTHPEQPDPARTAMTTMRIADVTGIPRETVRRKLASFERKGWISHHPGLGWSIAGQRNSSEVQTALADLEERSFRRLARLYLLLSQVLEDGARRTAD
ncbi:hypothetical protein L0V05_19445 [Tabrizicola sp. J26]|uniref:hypothetical protein n=1 Tax=Alitabrizicola rongguiensis TaxID=2909234 RepID=UPI001F3CE2D4|nr:hypothetical protein [Tabrizicola rongguiensis]MCF1710990.1 hypothetical protein [Tabrizicola rongguiensis]